MIQPSLKPLASALRGIVMLCLLCGPVHASAQRVKVLRQHDMARWGVPAGNYSGIAPLGNGRYALISDKQPADGWQEVSIAFKPSGDIASVTYEGAHFSSAAGAAPRDAEGIVATSGGTVFVSAESDQRIVELAADGSPTGRELEVPAWAGVANVFGNYGFEALARDTLTGDFWTTTEQGLRSDVTRTSGFDHRVPSLHRLMQFDASGRYMGAYAYRTETPVVGRRPRVYAFGVPALTVLADGSLLVAEREVAVPSGYNGAFVALRLFKVRPSAAARVEAEQSLGNLDAAAFVAKEEVVRFTTRLKYFGRKNLANYEGMCLGPRLADGRQTLILVADSQNRQGNRLFRLKDYLRVVVLPPEKSDY